jgi:membrane-bound inhibitor of C-type lysozyme
MVAGMARREQGVARQARAGTVAALLGLALAGCRDRAVAPAQTPRPPGAAAGPVNPDAGVTAYACADGQTITAGYPDARTAVVTYKGHAYTLKLARSAGGARYTGYGLQWQINGGHAAIAALKPGEETASAPGLDCTAAPESPAGEALTRTSSVSRPSSSIRRL